MAFYNEVVDAARSYNSVHSRVNNNIVFMTFRSNPDANSFFLAYSDKWNIDWDWDDAVIHYNEENPLGYTKSLIISEKSGDSITLTKDQLFDLIANPLIAVLSTYVPMALSVKVATELTEKEMSTLKW